MDIIISFDTTGSMFPCIMEVRKNIKNLVNRLFSDVPNIKIGIIAHGDYCDENKTYLIKSIDLTNDKSKLVDFVNSVENTYGGDYPEAYEYVLKEVQKISWQEDNRALLIIGDAYPHDMNDKANKYNIDWRVEIKEIKNMGINIYSVQALNSGNSKSYTFYKQMSEITNGYHLYLDQFAYIIDILLAICYNQIDKNKLEAFEQEIDKKEYGMNLSMRRIFDTMLKRKTIDYNFDDYNKSKNTEVSIDKLKNCPPAKYQIIKINNDCYIKDFVISSGLKFKTGKGFYEFTKPEIISDKKEVVLMHKSTGNLYEGTAAKKILNITSGDTRCKPSKLPDYKIFIQSSSWNRKLIANTSFLYEAEEYGL